MPTLVCPRCHRVNPADAHYCHFDGFSLRGGGAPVSAALAPFPQEFTFPSGRHCRTFDELVQGCQIEWEAARDLLRRGDFTRFFASIQRPDFSRAAQEATGQPDADIALYNFVSQFPASEGQGPRLDLNPRRLALGKVKAGEQRTLHLTIANQGKGLLQGHVRVTDGDKWLRIVDGPDDTQMPVRTGREQQIALRLDTRGLPCGNSYSAKLTTITNGGIAEVPLRFDLVAAPFPRPPFQGASTPRQLAEKMRTNPKAAVQLLETGDVRKWFQLNGWAYPVAGKAAPGIGSVQQFFEGMGLSKPPPLELSEKELTFNCTVGEVVEGALTLRTSVKKWVYGQIASDVDWLRIETPDVSGPQQAAIRFQVDAAQLEQAVVHEGRVLVTANAGQKMAARVRVEVRKPAKAFILRFLQPLVTLALTLLVLRILLMVPADLGGRLVSGTPRPDVTRGGFEFWKTAATADDTFLKHFVLATWWLGCVIVPVWVWRHGGRITDLVCGVFAGAGAGLIAAATFGCVLDYIDAVPRLLLVLLPGAGWSPWIATPLWLVTVAGWWTALGGVLAFPVLGVCRLCGFRRLAVLLGSR